MPGAAPTGDDRAGHRERLRRRLLSHGGKALDDYQLLELVLGMAIRRRDTRSLAKQLIGKFGGFAEVIAAEPQRIKEVPGAGEGVVGALKVVEAAMIRALRERTREENVLGGHQAVLDYCRAAMQHLKTERFHVIYLNRKNAVIADETLQEGTVDQTPVYPREVLRRALDLQASAVILVHNHPSGDPSPSPQDIATTRKIVEAAKALEVSVLDHIVIGRRGHWSFREQNML